MSDVTGSRILIQEEEVSYRSALSEALFFRMGAVTNFISKKQYDTHSWMLNGVYALGAGSTGPDGVFTFLFDAEIIGISYYSGNAGSGGTTSLDVHWLSSGDTDNGSIFSTKPSVDSTASDGTYTSRDIENNITHSLPTGHTLAVLSKTTFNAGETLRMDLDTAMPAANNFQLSIQYRPR